MTDTQVEVADKTKLPAELRAKMLESQDTIFFNVALFEHAQRIAEMFAKSTMLPEQFRNNMGNCMIALNYAARIGADPFMVAQTMYIVHGRPGVEGKLVAALINQSGKYRQPLEYEWVDEKGTRIERHAVVNDSKRDGRGCRAVTVDGRSGKPVVGPTITWEIVHAEGWLGKGGSKWKTIPELMFMYRAASWFSNVHCPEVKLGMHTTEELKDMDPIELKRNKNGAFVAEDVMAELKTSQTPTQDPSKEKISSPGANGEASTGNADGIDTAEGTSFRDEFINLRKPGYSTWVHKNKARIAEQPKEIHDEAKTKWTGFYPETSWPLEKAKDPDLSGANDEPDGPDVDGWLANDKNIVGLIECPRMDGNNTVRKTCRTCESRTRCESLTEKVMKGSA